MAWKFSLLVVANVTADSPELIQALKERAARDTCSFTLLVPAPAAGSVGREAAQERLEAALARMREAGLQNVEGRVGDPDPIVAVMDVWDPMKFDEVIVSTLPTGSSRWLGLDLPHRLEKLTSVPVRHVVSQPEREPAPAGPPPPQPQRMRGVLTALSAMITRR
jgi:hypothetical protein